MKKDRVHVEISHIGTANKKAQYSEFRQQHVVIEKKRYHYF